MKKKKSTSSVKPSHSRRPKGTEALSPEVLPPQKESELSRECATESADEWTGDANGDEDLIEEEPTSEEISSEMGSISPIETQNAGLESTAISSNDPLRRYLAELRKYPFLEAHEELALATRLRETGDLAAAKALVTANLRLVVKIAFEYRTFYSNLLDLVQEGNIGLMKAVSKFDPTKGARLGYYASWWIRSYILKYLLDNFRLVRVGTTQAQKKLFYHLMREKERLEAQGLFAGPKLLAQKLNVREKDVVEMEQRLSGQGAEVSLDAPMEPGEKRGPSHVDLLADHQEAVDEALEKNQLVRLLRDRLPQFEATLNEKELRILKDRLLSEEPKTLQEVADLYGLTRERARQIEAKVLDKLRNFLQPEIQ